MSEYLDTHDLLLRATAGDAPAQFNLAERYTRGEGVQQSSRNAAYWYARAADQGARLGAKGTGALPRSR